MKKLGEVLGLVPPEPKQWKCSSCGMVSSVLGGPATMGPRYEFVMKNGEPRCRGEAAGGHGYCDGVGHETF